ncbi:MAG: hypothetical protein ACKV2T_36930 [Kofleriaceae bacterium]
MLRLSNSLVVVLAGLVGCASEQGAIDEDGRDDSFTTGGKLDGFQCTPAEAAAILGVVNTASLATLKTDVQLVEKAADNIVAVRKGDDEVANTADDVEFGTLAQLDAVPYIGPVAFAKLLQYVHDADLVGDPPAPLGQWNTTTIANGAFWDFALAPDGKPVVGFRANGVHQLRLASGSVITLPPEYVTATNLSLAVDSAGDPHITYRKAGPSPANRFAHIVYRNGQWSSLGEFDASTLWLEQSPDGKMFALAAVRSCDTCWSDLTLHTLTASPTSESLWRVEDSWRLGFAVGADGFPAIGWDSRHHARRGPNGWTSLDMGVALPQQTLATTGGANATVFGVGDGRIRTYRQSGTTFDALEPRRGHAGGYIDATVDGDGTAHACYIKSDNVVHLQATTTGTVIETSHHNAKYCMLATDLAGKVHMVTSFGNLINHAVYE